MSINTIAAASSLNYWQQQEHARTDYNLHSAASTFSQLLARLTATQAAASSEEESGVSPVTLTKLLSDGSIVILKVEGNQIISEAKRWYECFRAAASAGKSCAVCRSDG